MASPVPNGRHGSNRQGSQHAAGRARRLIVAAAARKPRNGLQRVVHRGRAVMQPSSLRRMTAGAAARRTTLPSSSAAARRGLPAITRTGRVVRRPAAFSDHVEDQFGAATAARSAAAMLPPSREGDGVEVPVWFVGRAKLTAALQGRRQAAAMRLQSQHKHSCRQSSAPSAGKRDRSSWKAASSADAPSDKVSRLYR